MATYRIQSISTGKQITIAETTNINGDGTSDLLITDEVFQEILSDLRGLDVVGDVEDSAIYKQVNDLKYTEPV